MCTFQSISTLASRAVSPILSKEPLRYQDH
jgi:hypothetical protein